jgi:hypothetical protein
VHKEIEIDYSVKNDLNIVSKSIKSFVIFLLLRGVYKIALILFLEYEKTVLCSRKTIMFLSLSKRSGVVLLLRQVIS